MAGDDELANPLGRDKRVERTWLEGVYTFRRELRLTLKLPRVEQQRTVLRGGEFRLGIGFVF